MAYRVVIIPPSLTLAETTVRLLHQFANAGGSVLAIEPCPTLVYGRPSAGPVLPGATRLVTIDGLAEALDALLPFDVRIVGRPSVWVHHRRVEGAEVYFLANTDLESGGPVTVQLRGSGCLDAWDPASGLVRPQASRPCGEISEVELDLPPQGSQLLMLYPDRSPNEVQPVCTRAVWAEVLANTWTLGLDGLNTLTLDTPQVMINGRDWSEPQHILDAHAAVAAAGTSAPFCLRFAVDVAVIPPGPIYLVMESPGRFEISVNGQPVPGTDAGWWTDISFRKVDIRGVLVVGSNQIVLSGVFGRDSALESVYLLGSFGVTARRIGEENRHNGQVFDRYAPDFQVSALAQEAHAGGGGLGLDLTAQGLPFFAGRVRLGQTVRMPAPDGPVMLELQGMRAALAHVRVNGLQMGTLAWPPHRVDIRAAVHPGENHIEIELVGTLRNLLGPHHRSGGDKTSTAPWDFRDRQQWTENYILVPFGFEQVKLTAFETAPAG